MFNKQSRVAHVLRQMHEASSQIKSLKKELTVTLKSNHPASGRYDTRAYVNESGSIVLSNGFSCVIITLPEAVMLRDWLNSITEPELP